MVSLEKVLEVVVSAEEEKMALEVKTWDDVVGEENDRDWITGASEEVGGDSENTEEVVGNAEEETGVVSEETVGGEDVWLKGFDSDVNGVLVSEAWNDMEDDVVGDEDEVGDGDDVDEGMDDVVDEDVDVEEDVDGVEDGVVKEEVEEEVVVGDDMTTLLEMGADIDVWSVDDVAGDDAEAGVRELNVA